MSAPTTAFTPPPTSHWPSSHFVLSAGTATFQPSTGKVLVIQDTARSPAGTPRESAAWFLPRGRKDIGETLEACAVRETLEEGGYVATLLRSPHPTRQPPGATEHTEAFHLQIMPYLPHRATQLPTSIVDINLYVAFWYLCVIPADARRVDDYGAQFVGRHEMGYNSELVDVAEAVLLLSGGRYEYRDGDKGGVVVERKTGQTVEWGDVKAGWDSGVEAVVVARGWEVVKSVYGEGWEDVEGKEEGEGGEGVDK